MVRSVTLKPLVILMILGFCIRLATGIHLFLQHQKNSNDDIYWNQNNVQEYQYPLNERMKGDEILEEVMTVLGKLLILPWPRGESPFIYIEQYKIHTYDDAPKISEDKIKKVNEIGQTHSKRMRYYRKYPWKKENMRYNPENPFVCYPSKFEIRHLLIALRKSQYNGFNSVPVEFCNRKRPAHTILTNIRFG